MNTAADDGFTREQLAADLMRLGLTRGATVLVHASLRLVRPLGRQPAVVVDALLDVIGRQGTLVVPAYTTWNSTSSTAFRSAIAGMTPSEIDAYKQSLPSFDPLATPVWRMGVLAEYVRTMKGAFRSAHPQSSFAAIGAKAEKLMACHTRNCHLGEHSPLGAMYTEDASVLMLGTEYSTSSVFHLAESYYTAKPLRVYECRVAGEVDDDPERLAGWTSFKDIDYDDSDFHLLGADFEDGSGRVRRESVGGAPSRFYGVRCAVDFATVWMAEHRA